MGAFLFGSGNNLRIFVLPRKSIWDVSRYVRANYHIYVRKIAKYVCGPAVPCAPVSQENRA